MHSLPQDRPPVPREQPQPSIPRSIPTATKSERKFSMGQITEPDWLNFTLSTYSFFVTSAMVLRGSPWHGWMVANAKPVGWIAACLLACGLEKLFAHFTKARGPRLLFRPISVVTGAIALVVLLYYSQV